MKASEFIFTWASALIIAACFVIWLVEEPYFHYWEQCRIAAGDFQEGNYWKHPFINGSCCGYELIQGDIRCVKA